MYSIKFFIITLCILLVSGCAHKRWEGRNHKGFDDRSGRTMGNRGKLNDQTSNYSKSNHLNKVKAITPSLDKALSYRVVGTNQSLFYSDTRSIGKPEKGESYYGQNANAFTPPAFAMATNLSFSR